MKMFYMERGAGSSNLKMKFNLTSVKPGEVRIGKTLSGTDKQDYASTQFAYQVWYDPGTGFELVDPTKCDVFYAETTEPVAYQREYHGYDHVFMLRPGEEMTVQLPDDEIEYYVTECYVQSNIYDEVTANGTVLTGVGNGHRDYTSSTAEAGKRKKLIYNNHVDENALRTLRITKRLYDFQGNRLDAGDDPTGFMFRLYLGDALDYYRFDTYYVLDPNGMYCRYDSATRKFVSLGVDDFNRLTDAQKEQAGFLTSMNGAVDKIPADYTVELRDLLVGTKFKVEERNADIPKGYRLRDPNGYTRVDGSYIIEEGDTENSGVIRDNANPHIEINNVRGWGVTATKIWSDDSFMDYHDDLYFGIYVNGTLVPDTLRELDASDGEKSLYWFFEDLLYSDDFDDYVVREVKVEDPVVDADGYVTSFTSAAPITGTFSHGGKQKDTAYRPDYRYEVTYRQGVPTGAAHHIREDEVENTREGLKLVKTDWDGNPISGGTFIFTDENGAFPGAESYTAGTDGLITIAYVPPGTYTLTETEAPFGYARLEESIEVTIASDGTVTAAASDPANVNVTQATASARAKVELKNKEYEFKVKKIDGGTGDPIEGVHFAIFRDILGVKDYSPLAGYENLVTDEDGFLPETISELQGTFYLQELRPETGFLPLEGPIKFTVSKTGDVSIADTQYADWLTENSTGSKKCWLLTVPNHDSVDIAVEKKLTGNMARRGDTFPFAVSDVRLKNGTVLTGSFPYEIHRKTAEIEAGTAQISGGVTFVSASGSSSTVTLGQDDRLVLLGLPKDVSFKVAELAADGYRTSFTVSNIGNRIVYYDGTAVTPAGSTANVTTSVSGREAVINGTSTGLLVEVENRRHAPVPTGTQPLRLKLILLTLLSALSAFIALGAWKRRKK